MSYIRKGWKSTLSQFPVIILLFLYQLLWSVFLYKLVNSAVMPLLARYPDPAPNSISRLLFLIEGQLELQQNTNVFIYGWILAGMFILRLVITPFIHAGIFQGLLAHEEEGAGWVFFHGMKKLWRPVCLFYVLELICIVIPSYWLLPKLYSLLLLWLQTGTNSPLFHLSLYILGWWVYGYLIHQSLLFAQFGYISQEGAFSALWIYLKNFIPGILISLFLGVISLLLFSLISTVSWIWVGLLSLLLHQFYPFPHSVLKLWHISSQFDLWQSKSQKS